MGRLTLNMLLSFAQFEREVTGERIRDKIAASKRKGIWMGGPVPLGYDVHDRKLVVNEIEAQLVRNIMRRYVALSSVNELIDELKAHGHRTKIQQRVSGPHRGSITFGRGTLFHLLKNRIYLGETVHKGVAHPGEHSAIVDQALWDSVQAALAERAGGSSTRSPVRQPSLFVGIISDGLGRPMTPTHAKKGSRRYRYYVTRSDQPRGAAAWRVPAHDLEKIVLERLATMLLDRTLLYDLVASNHGVAAAIQSAIRHGADAAATLQSGSASDKTALVQTLVEGVALTDGSINIEVSRNSLLSLIGVTIEGVRHNLASIHLTCSSVKIRQGHDVRLVIPGPGKPQPIKCVRDEKLVALLAEAHAARTLVLSRPEQSINRIATDAGRCRTRLARLFSLSHLAPDIVTAIFEGRQPTSITHRSLLESELPVDWADQRKALAL
jgi:site-specific DNA recombinase